MNIDLKKFNETLKQAMGQEDNPEAKYYFIVESDYYIPGHYWNDDIKAYTPEGDNNASDPTEIYGYYTWDQMETELDDMLLLTDDVPEEPTTEIDHEEGGHKIICEYEVEREVEMDDEEGYSGIYYYTYTVKVCLKQEEKNESFNEEDKQATDKLSRPIMIGDLVVHFTGGAGYSPLHTELGKVVAVNIEKYKIQIDKNGKFSWISPRNCIITVDRKQA